jgi:mRNA interferase MazF
MPCKRGDVVLVLYPHADLRTVKKRPALVVQSDNVTTGLPQRIVAMITSNLERGPVRHASSSAEITRKGVRWAS